MREAQVLRRERERERERDRKRERKKERAREVLVTREHALHYAAFR